MRNNKFYDIIRSQRKGNALLLAVFAVILLFITGSTLLGMGLHARVYSVKIANDIQAQCAADSGLQIALYHVNQGLETELSGEDSQFVSITNYLPNSNASFSYIISGDAASGYLIESTGICGISTKKVHALLKSEGLFDYAIAVQNNVVLKPGSYLDGYNFENSEDKPKLITTSILPMQIILAKSTLIDGDVAVGVGGVPADVIIAPDATITGTVGTLTRDIDFPSINVPSYLLSLPSSGIIGGSMTLDTSSKYDGINLGRGDIVTVDGPVTLYIAGDLILGNASEIQINKDNPDASLTIYLEGNLYSKNGGTINNFTEDPTKLKIFGLDTCDQITFATAGSFYGGIYAPNARFNLLSSVELYGAFSTSSFIQGVSSNVHYDAALKNDSSSGFGSKYKIVRWWE